MKVYRSRFNLFFALTVLLSSLCGCSLFGHKDEVDGAMRIHIAVAPDNVTTMGGAETIKVLRVDPVEVTIDKQPILTEANLVAARLISTPDAPAIEMRFDENGSWILQQYSASNPGGHFVIFGQWGKGLKNSRWLGAPLISKRIDNGLLSFTPDMTRDEANQLVQGLNNAAKKFQSSSLP
jgi:preprotein translocase subunit SecD